jgi:endonuclease-3
MAQAPAEHLEQLIRSTGFFRAKTKSLLGCSRALTEQHQGLVPRDLATLVKLPGTGRKTANVVLSHAFGLAEGIAVDTHVLRVSNRLGLAKGDNAVEIERQLMAAIPKERWARTTDLLIFHGRKICDARRPACGSCPVFDLCRWKDRQAVALGTAGPRSAARKTSRGASPGQRSLPKRGRR